jgi:amidase
MAMLDAYLEAWQIRDLVLKKKVRPREVAEFFNARVERLNPRLNAFITPTPERALADAERIEKVRGADAAKLPLFGVPYSIKDLTWTRDIRTTLGSRNYANWHAPADAVLVTMLRDAGGILLGKTATPEFGLRPTTEGGYCGPARNPWNPERTTGGSSGGAGCAVASGMGAVAEGSDGGGSIRIPSACCGCVGLKPSRGRVSYAPMAGEQWAGFATSGPMARSVRDAALLLDVLAQPQPGDPYFAIPPKEPFARAVRKPRRKLRLAAISASALGPTDSEVKAAFDKACRTFREMGHRVEPIKLDPASRLVTWFATIVRVWTAAAPVEHEEWLDPTVQETRELGKGISGADYVNALTQLHNGAREIVEALLPYDALLTPTLTRPAVALGTINRIEEMLAWIPFTFPFNVTGQPAFSLPNGFSKDGLPIGLQIVGRQNDEAGIISIATAFEQAQPWRDRHPPVD